jgi:hypothetical protein
MLGVDAGGRKSGKSSTHKSATKAGEEEKSMKGKAGVDEAKDMQTCLIRALRCVDARYKRREMENISKFSHFAFFIPHGTIYAVKFHFQRRLIALGSSRTFDLSESPTDPAKSATSIR